MSCRLVPCSQHSKAPALSLHPLTIMEPHNDNIAVFVRVRQQDGPKGVSNRANTITLHTPSTEDRSFSFDGTFGETSTQESIFESIGQPLSDACMAGYNGTIFAYGQTGSGKTYTMGIGDTEAATIGLAPRVLDYLFAWMARDERKTSGKLSYRCTGSLLEIHNEHITDLLDPLDATPGQSWGAIGAAAGGGGGTAGLRLREDATRGIYVEGLTLEELHSADEARALLRSGAAHRAVGATAMNAASSRSHLVFTLSLQAVHESEDGIKRVRSSQLHLVDLAGSERQRDTHATGARLREACSINKSLSALGNVITALTSGSADR